MFRHALRVLSTYPRSWPINLYSSYSSVFALKNLYPDSSLNLSLNVKVPERDGVSFSGYIPIEKLDITYSRSSGPGGQHVNVVNTKVDVRFHVLTADWLNQSIKETLLEKCKNRITKEGYLVVRSEKTRSRIYNQADAITTLRELIRHAAAPKSTKPSEQTLHMLRKRREKANSERLRDKKIRSMVKSSRSDLDL